MKRHYLEHIYEVQLRVCWESSIDQQKVAGDLHGIDDRPHGAQRSSYQKYDDEVGAKECLQRGLTLLGYLEKLL